MLAGIISFVEILQIKYLNNRVEQDHRFIKKITKPMMGFKAFHPLFSIALNEQFVNWSCRSKYETPAGIGRYAKLYITAIMLSVLLCIAVMPRT